MASAFLAARVIENKQWAENLFSVRLEAELQPFKAGQFVRVQLQIDGGPMAKPYSLVNSPEQDIAEVFYNIVPDGPMSNGLAALKPNDTIEISQPAAGFFVLDELPDTKNLWMFATGTGLGPYLSILQQNEVWDKFDKLVLVHAVSYANNLAYQEMISGFSESSQFCYVPIVSREDKAGALKGRIPALISDGQFEAAANLKIEPETTHIMLCGNQNMIADARSVLAEKGLRKHLRRKPGHITTEQYF